MKVLTRIILGALSSLVMTASAAAADYYVVGGTERGVVVVEASSLKKDGDTVRGAVLTIFRRGGDIEKSTGRSYAREMREIQCAADKSRSLTTTYFGADHKDLGAITTPSDWKAVDPDGLNAATLEAFCKTDLTKAPTLLRAISQEAMVKFGGDYLEDKLRELKAQPAPN